MPELRSTVDLVDSLPLPLLRSDTVPPAPTRSPTGSTIDWIPDFAGYAWVAYGASSLLVISHLPSPLSAEETSIGPILRQVFQLPLHVVSVSWSSGGEVASASGCCIFLFSPDSITGSFCWSQNAILRQSPKVEVVKWTESGDGIVAGGVEVVLWQRKGTTWEIAWKLKTDLPQTLVSTTWSVEGPSAVATYPNIQKAEEALVNEGHRCVLVCQNDGKNGYSRAELWHPQLVLMIQWRPSTEAHQKSNLRTRNVLLTCCIDGAMRLWTEIDHGRAKKVVKDGTDPKVVQHSFCVVAIIEMDPGLHANLNENLFVMWAKETGGLYKLGDAATHLFSTDVYEHERTGQCEWLVGFGPKMKITFWAIHCLDEFSPLRYPRVTLWKTKELDSREFGHVPNIAYSKGADGSVVKKVVISRNSSTGPPIFCSLLQFSQFNSLVWSMFYNRKPSREDELSPNTSAAENFLPCSAGGVLTSDGHSGKILQAVMHPYCCEDVLVASLDSYGLLLFWSSPVISNFIHSIPLSVPTLKLSGRVVTRETDPKYTSLRWAPSILDDNRILLLGHVDGIDCLMVRIPKQDAMKSEYHRLCTIPFSGHDHIYDGISDIYSTSLPSTCNKTFKSANFMLIGVMKSFHAVSWEIVIHSYELSGSYCECNFENNPTDNCNILKYESVFAGRRYCLRVSPCSSLIPNPHDSELDQVTCFCVVCPSGFFPFSQQDRMSANDLHFGYPPFIIATGYSDGRLKLWRINNKVNPSHTWELVGVLVTQQGPIGKISVSDCGQKIATVSVTSNANTTKTLKIWGSMYIMGAGSFVLEDTTSLDSDVVSMKWFSLGNGNQILGVCMPDKLQVYSLICSGGEHLSKSGNSSHMHGWFPIAYAQISPPASDFFWGPGAIPLVVLQDYISIYGQVIHCEDGELRRDLQLIYEHKVSFCNEGSITRNALSAIFTDNDISNFERLSIEGNGRGYSSRINELLGMNRNHVNDQFLSERAFLKSAFPIKLGSWTMLEVVEQLSGSLPIHHPAALRYNILSGNWRRAYIALQHLVGHLSGATERRNSHENPANMVPQIDLSHYLDGVPLENSSNKGSKWSGNATSAASSFQFYRGLSKLDSDMGSDVSTNIVAASSSKYEFAGIADCVEKCCQAVGIGDEEKKEILAVIDLLSEISNSQSASVYGSLDEPGRRFWVAVRYQQLYTFRKFGRAASLDELVVDSSTICWAFHSDCQESLLSSVLPSEPSWQEIRAMGVGLWFTNATQLRTRMEKLARLQYLKKKDPKDCALLYIALNRLQVLAGLFKISRDEKDKPLVGFLSRNFQFQFCISEDHFIDCPGEVSFINQFVEHEFLSIAIYDTINRLLSYKLQEEKNKAAALKNAYVLLGRHQLELAVAFFLLGGDTSSAVTVCAKNLGDEQLALVLCRLIEGGGGGPLEHQLIEKLMLPSAIEKGDHWLASLLEWQLGNYSQSFFHMLGLQTCAFTNKFSLSSNHIAFLDPSIGLYCRLLTAKTSLRNAVGEHDIAVFVRWANLIMATAVKRCGLPIESLECFSFLNLVGGSDHGSLKDGADSEVLPCMLNPSSGNSSNWLSGDVALNLEYHAKLDLALQHFSKFIKEHPGWPNSSYSNTNWRCEDLLGHFRSKLYMDLALIEQKFSLHAASLLTKILVLPGNYGASFVGFDILQGYREKSPHAKDIPDFLDLYSLLSKIPWTLTNKISNLFSRFIAVCGISFPQIYSHCMKTDELDHIRSSCPLEWANHVQSLVQSSRSLRAASKIFSGSSDGGLLKILSAVLDLLEFLAEFASFWFQRNLKSLILILQPLITSFSHGHTPYEVDSEALRKVLDNLSNSVPYISTVDGFGCRPYVSESVTDRAESISDMIPEDERWQILGASLWLQMSILLNHKLSMAHDRLEDGNHSGSSLSGPSSACTSANFDALDKNALEQIRLLLLALFQSLRLALSHVSSTQVKKLAALVQQKIDHGWPAMTLVWLEEYGQSRTRALHEPPAERDIISNADTNNNEELFKVLWNFFVDPKVISESFTEENINLSEYVQKKPCKDWKEVHKSLMIEENRRNNDESRNKNSSARSEVGSPSKVSSSNTYTSLASWKKEAILTKDTTPFLCPREVYKRNGELLEALCINSTNERQIAVSSNRKGIIFLNWEEDLPSREEREYVWSEADWPQNGWAGAESTPVPTYVSPGVGLGSKKGSHLGLGGATIGMGSLATPGRDLTGGGAFGVPGYAGIGASGLGWEIQEEFEELVEQPATLDNVRTRAFSRHPSRPYFLVGSSNTHIYLWEFGKEKAIATYGVLPAANVPPPYSLASISAVQFDHCGHRFATAALDGTICTWQSEVGGRSNIHPTESSLCFNSQAMDVTYVTSSGTIIAAAGHSTNNVNVVIWDTLAPPSTSRASIICHEGGARSVSVFDNDVGSGSVSPLILTGGRGGDVGLHDFRYIATGRSKRQRRSDNGLQNPQSSLTTDGPTATNIKDGVENVGGMLWYLPKAHLGSVTKISWIPGTNLFLTGSKDGDVKLWDVKNAKLVHHWSKLHDRHTFLQPSTRGFGGLVRAGVTDVQVVSHGFLTCGGDGTVKLIELGDYLRRM